jgi:hypothetical protein
MGRRHQRLRYLLELGSGSREHREALIGGKRQSGLEGLVLLWCSPGCWCGERKGGREESVGDFNDSRSHNARTAQGELNALEPDEEGVDGAT